MWRVRETFAAFDRRRGPERFQITAWRPTSLSVFVIFLNLQNKCRDSASNKVTATFLHIPTKSRPTYHHANHSHINR